MTNLWQLPGLNENKMFILKSWLKHLRKFEVLSQLIIIFCVIHSRQHRIKLPKFKRDLFKSCYFYIVVCNSNNFQNISIYLINSL